MQEPGRRYGAADGDGVALAQGEPRLAVAVDARVFAALHGDRDHRGVVDGDGSVGERVRRDGHQRERRHVRRDDRAAGRQRVGGRSGRRGDDQAVGAHRIDEAAVDLDAHLDHAAAAAAVDDDVVERDAAIAVDLGVEQGPSLLDEASVEYRADRRLHVGERDVGEEPEAALVDADQRQVEGRDLARDRQHRAVAAHDDDDVGVAGDLADGHRRIARQAGLCRRLGAENDRPAASGQERSEVRERPGNPGGPQAADEPDPEKAWRGGGHGRD